jgi:catechol 2,3-dioxygenase-like lactoylglutathione lyase family enzyme
MGVDPHVAGSVVNHIGLCVHDIDRSRRFYEELLGFEYESEIAPPDDLTGRLLQLEPPLGLRAVYLRKDGLLLELLAYDPRRRPRRERPMDEPGLTHVSIGAEDPRRLLDRVEALGGTVVADTDIGVAVFIRDPDGQLIELLETKGAGRA